MTGKPCDDRPRILVPNWVIARKASSNRCNFCLRLSRRAPISKPAEHLQQMRISCLIREPGEARERLPHVADDWEPEAVRHDAYDRGGHAVDAYRTTNHCRVCVVPRCPNTVA